MRYVGSHDVQDDGEDRREPLAFRLARHVHTRLLIANPLERDVEHNVREIAAAICAGIDLEREACAKIADAWAHLSSYDAGIVAGTKIAEVIRDRKTETQTRN